jgi:hypothetical protein
LFLVFNGIHGGVRSNGYRIDKILDKLNVSCYHALWSWHSKWLSRRASFLLALSASLRNSFPSYHILVSSFFSSGCALFSAMARLQLLWIKCLLHSFHRHGGGYPLQPQKGQTMNSQASSTTAIALPGRSDAKCTHFTAQGRRCRLRALRSGLCFRHAALQVQPAQPVDVCRADQSISRQAPHPRRAKPYLRAPRRRPRLLTNQLLRTLTAIAKEANAEPTQIIFDMPGPDRDKPDQTAPQAAAL